MLEGSRGFQSQFRYGYMVESRSSYGTDFDSFEIAGSDLGWTLKSDLRPAPEIWGRSSSALIEVWSWTTPP